MHLNALADAADKNAAKEASRRKETEAIGEALQQATDMKAAHQEDLHRLEDELALLQQTKSEVEQYLQNVPKYTTLLAQKDDAEGDLADARQNEQRLRGDLQSAMRDAWRGMLRGRIREAREAAEKEAQAAHQHIVHQLRAAAIESGQCGICEQTLEASTKQRLKGEQKDEDETYDIEAAMTRLAQLRKFDDTDPAPLIRELWKSLQDNLMTQAALKDHLSDLAAALSDADPQTIRKYQTTQSDVIEKIHVVKMARDEAQAKIVEQDQSIQRLNKKLESSGTPDVKAAQRKAKLLRNAANVFDAAVERYKSELRTKVEETATDFFTSMTTEKEDYAGLTINESYGLTIRHQDGRAEEARSAGAEHVVALALMGALQNNAPLRGPIVMDSPFGRLDDGHTSNVVRTLPDMAPHVVLLVYESEVGRGRMRELLGSKLVREYELERIDSRRTNIVPVQ